MTLSRNGGPDAEAYPEPAAVGTALIEIRLFLPPEDHVPAPLEAAYQSAWEAVRAYWREVIAREAASS